MTVTAFMPKRKYKQWGNIRFRFFGFVSCKKCAEGWKHKLMSKGKNVRVVPVKAGGWEVWAT